MPLTADDAFRLVEALRVRGLHVIVRAIPDVADVETDDGRYSVMIRGYPLFTGPTWIEAFTRLAKSRCWESPASAGNAVRSVKIADILEEVRECATGYTAPFRADELAVELGINPSAAAQALKKLNWPRSSHKTQITLNGRELDVYVYLPQVG